MGVALAIRDDLTAAELRRRARFEPNRWAALRLLAIANALEGLSRAASARLAAMERQALRDAVVRDNAEGLAELLYDRPKPVITSAGVTARSRRQPSNQPSRLASRVGTAAVSSAS